MTMRYPAIWLRRLSPVLFFQWAFASLLAADPFINAQWVLVMKPDVPPTAVRFTEECFLLSAAEADTLRKSVFLKEGGKVSSVVSTLRLTRDHAVTLTDSSLNFPDEPTSKIRIIRGGVPQEFTVRTVGVEVGLTGETGADGRVQVRAKATQTKFIGFKEYKGSGSNKPVPDIFYQPIFESVEREHAFTLGPDQVAVLRFQERRLAKADPQRIDFSRLPSFGVWDRSFLKKKEPEVSLLLVSLVAERPDAEPIK